MSYTNSSLSTARRCLAEYDMDYNLQLKLIGEDSDPLIIGQLWHKAHDEAFKHGDDAFAYQVFKDGAPSELWEEKLRRLFAAYRWYWKDQPLTVTESEETFALTFAGNEYRGQLDGRLRASDERKGLLERKTTADGVDAESDYWRKLRMDTQIGIYSLAAQELPDFILYDVVRKPTIGGKKISKADIKRLTNEHEKLGAATYYGESFTSAQLANALEEGRESVAMYGARLTADIGDRPDYYFARREVSRTAEDYKSLLEGLDDQVTLIQHAEKLNLMHRNPDACHFFHRPCQFFSLCSNNIRPRAGDPAPDGFEIREHKHPELVKP